MAKNPLVIILFTSFFLHDNYIIVIFDPKNDYIMNQNPFITSGYVSPEYFCDREQESAELIMDIEGRNNKVMISPRRMGKTGLILHCFHQARLRENYYCFFIDIYSTLNLSDFIVLLGNKIWFIRNSP